ncbi:glucan synthase [Kibdelosporangium aridum]|uniref:Glucan synthase n=1 Tax=Kibdelosporangium aridum TaxID=2030 RepID=A0A428YX14_KIBAR|nr:glucan synthase [Kibdelosporangium aridum]
MVAAVVVIGLVTVLLVANTEPGAGPRPTTTPTRTTGASTPPRPVLTVDSGCLIGQGRERLVDVPQQVTDRVNRAWERIEKWLAAKTPAVAQVLAAPATLDEISEMQRQIGVPVPPELIASLLRHNGAGTSVLGIVLPPFYVPMSTSRVVSEAKMMCDILVSNGHNESAGSWWHGQVIPFAFDGGGGNLLLDQRPGRNGRLGRHYEETDMMFDRWPPTLTELLEQTATAMETGGLVMGRFRPKVVENGLLEWDIG